MMIIIIISTDIIHTTNLLSFWSVWCQLYLGTGAGFTKFSTPPSSVMTANFFHIGSFTSFRPSRRQWPATHHHGCSLPQPPETQPPQVSSTGRWSVHMGEKPEIPAQNNCSCSDPAANSWTKWPVHMASHYWSSTWICLKITTQQPIMVYQQFSMNMAILGQLLASKHLHLPLVTCHCRTFPSWKGSKLVSGPSAGGVGCSTPI